MFDCVGRYLGHDHVMFFWDDKDVAGCRWEDVKYCDAFFVFVDFLGRLRSCDDFAEDALLFLPCAEFFRAHLGKLFLELLALKVFHGFCHGGFWE